MTASNYKRGAPLTIETMRALARAHGGRCLSSAYLDRSARLDWQCGQGHTWQSTYRNVQAGCWCPVCSKARRNEAWLEEMRALARKRGGRCLSEKYVSSRVKLRWQCAKGHTWDATSIPIVHSGTWCPTCGREKNRLKSKRKLTIEDMQALARTHGGRCLSPTYADIYTEMDWQCGQGHTWKSRATNVLAGGWCVICNKARREAKWLDEMRALARERGGRCLSDAYVEGKVKLRWQCAQGHVWEAAPARVRLQGSWCPVCAIGKTRLTLDDMHAEARARGGECLSTHYAGTATKLRWRCAKGHEWDARPAEVRGGLWCPKCRQRKKKPLTLTIERLQAIARAHGGECLATHYAGDGSKLRWRCAEGHEWLSVAWNITGGKWCPQCGHNRYTIDDMRALARERGGECLSPKYVNSVTKLHWRCKLGHEWSTMPLVVRQGCWCPECAWLSRSTKEETRRKYLPVGIQDTLGNPVKASAKTSAKTLVKR